MYFSTVLKEIGKFEGEKKPKKPKFGGVLQFQTSDQTIHIYFP
jgi:hypothetical protein